MNIETFATNLSNQTPSPLPSKTNIILVGYDERAKNNFINFYMENVLTEDVNSSVFYLNNLSKEHNHPRVALMEDQYIITLDYLYHQLISRKKQINGSDQIYVIIREINDLISDPLIKYHQDTENPDSYAMKLGRLINEGYAVNINFVLNLKNDKIPTQLKSGFLDLIYFKTSDYEDKNKAFEEIKKDNQFFYSNNLFIINENRYPFKLKDENESKLQKDIKKHTSKVFEADLKNLTNDALLKPILIKLFCNYGATAIEEPTFKMSEISFNFEYQSTKYSVFIYHPGFDQQLENAAELASHLEKSAEILVVNLDKDTLVLKNIDKKNILFKKDLTDLINFKIDEDKMEDQELKNKVKLRLKFFNN